jgi:hypothetical protein
MVFLVAFSISDATVLLTSENISVVPAKKLAPNLEISVLNWRIRTAYWTEPLHNSAGRERERKRGLWRVERYLSGKT